MAHRFPVLLAAVAVALGGAGCGGRGDSQPVRTNEVEMAKSYRFEPAVVEIDAGDTVTWRNDDNFTHTVEVEGRPDYEVERGATVSITFEKPGTYDYVCTLHSHDMRGQVVVR